MIFELITSWVTGSFGQHGHAHRTWHWHS